MSAASVPVSGPPVAVTKRRRWFLAAPLSFFCPGLGQIYNGQARRGLKIFIGLQLVVLATILVSHWMSASIALFAAFFGLVAIVMALQLFATIDAAVRAWRLKSIELRRFNRVWVYLLALAIGFASNEALTSSLNFGAWNIPSGAMLPTLQIGDHLFADKRYFAGHEAQYGDLVVFKLPTDGKTDYIKRIVGLPGDTIQMIGGRLHINGKAVERTRIHDEVQQRGAMTVLVPQYIETLPGGRSYRIREERGDEGMLDNTPSYMVPADHYFAMGDNRDNSQDSRVLSEVGFVPRANLRDRPGFVYWSRDRSRIGLRVE
jgi:signal peptidase I